MSRTPSRSPPPDRDSGEPPVPPGSTGFNASPPFMPNVGASDPTPSDPTARPRRSLAELAAAQDAVDDTAGGSLQAFAYFPRGGFDVAIAELATKVMPETWAGKNDHSGRIDPYLVLKNYLNMAFKYIVETQPDKLKRGGPFIVFDTRLLSPFSLGLLPVYALFERNHNPGKQPYCFKKWCTGWGQVVCECVDPATRERKFGSQTVKAFSPELSTNALPEWWKEFRADLPFNYNADHILRENIDRLRELCTDPDASTPPPSELEIAAKLIAGLECAKRFAQLNPRRVLPQLFLPGGFAGGRGFVRQLLVPLHLRSLPAADSALTVQLDRDPDTGGWMYTAATVLPLRWAFMNARLVNSVESPWLQRIIHEQHEAIVDLTQQLAAASAT